MATTPHTRSHFAHTLFRHHPDLRALVEDHVLKMTRDLATDDPIRLDELLFYGSAAHDTDEPWREDVELLDEFLIWVLGAIVLCEAGTLHARYHVTNAGTRDETATILLSADTEEAE